MGAIVGQLHRFSAELAASGSCLFSNFFPCFPWTQNPKTWPIEPFPTTGIKELLDPTNLQSGKIHLRASVPGNESRFLAARPSGIKNSPPAGFFYPCKPGKISSLTPQQAPR